MAFIDERDILLTCYSQAGGAGGAQAALQLAATAGVEVAITGKLYHYDIQMPAQPYVRTRHR